MSRIVADLLLLARSSNMLDLREQDVNLGGLMEDTLKSIPEDQGKIEMEVDPRLMAFVDADRLQQVFGNLAVNAMRYGGGRVLMAASALGRDLVIEVHDNGEGVPRKYELAIWEQFERGAHRLNSSVPGSGIGLAIVDMIVKRHGGTARYERSKRLGGSCFKITMPGRVRADEPVPSALGATV
jgi:two-component system sensor histidine kinase RstB